MDECYSDTALAAESIPLKGSVTLTSSGQAKLPVAVAVPWDTKRPASGHILNQSKEVDFLYLVMNRKSVRKLSEKPLHSF